MGFRASDPWRQEIARCPNTFETSEITHRAQRHSLRANLFEDRQFNRCGRTITVVDYLSPDLEIS